MKQTLYKRCGDFKIGVLFCIFTVELPPFSHFYCGGFFQGGVHGTEIKTHITPPNWDLFFFFSNFLPTKGPLTCYSQAFCSGLRGFLEACYGKIQPTLIFLPLFFIISCGVITYVGESFPDGLLFCQDAY